MNIDTIRKLRPGDRVLLRVGGKGSTDREECKVIQNSGLMLVLDHGGRLSRMTYQDGYEHITSVSFEVKTLDVDMEAIWKEMENRSVTNPPTWPRSAKRPQMMQVQVPEQESPWSNALPTEPGYYLLKDWSEPWPELLFVWRCGDTMMWCRDAAFQRTESNPLDELSDERNQWMPVPRWPEG